MLSPSFRRALFERVQQMMSVEAHARHWPMIFLIDTGEDKDDGKFIFACEYGHRAKPLADAVSVIHVAQELQNSTHASQQDASLGDPLRGAQEQEHTQSRTKGNLEINHRLHPRHFIAPETHSLVPRHDWAGSCLPGCKR